MSPRDDSKQIGIYIRLILEAIDKINKQAMTGNWNNQNPKIPPLKPKREITKITNSQNTKSTYGQSSEQLFPKRWPFINLNRIENNPYKHLVKRHRNR